jgi:hypothetical protein
MDGLIVVVVMRDVEDGWRDPVSSGKEHGSGVVFRLGKARRTVASMYRSRRKPLLRLEVPVGKRSVLRGRRRGRRAGAIIGT